MWYGAPGLLLGKIHFKLHRIITQPQSINGRPGWEGEVWVWCINVYFIEMVLMVRKEN